MSEARDTRVGRRGHRTSERIEGHERSEGNERRTAADDAAASEPKPPPGRRTGSRSASHSHRPPNALGPFIPEGTA
jgi:hypothetical protein